MARTITFGSQIAADEVEPFFAVKLDFSGDFTRTFLVTVGTTAALLYDGSKMSTSHGLELAASSRADVTTEGEGGTYGGFVYLLNTSTVDSGTTNVIYVGVDHDGGGTSNDDISNSDQEEDGSKTTRLFTLKCGEFAFFPFDYTMDIIVDANLAGQTLECWHWNRSAS